MKRLLLLSVSAGAGHGRAAEALRAEAQASFPDVNAKHIDVMTLIAKEFSEIVRGLLHQDRRAPSVGVGVPVSRHG
jgi:processive 1,2-diacylglycerol beta-glucosyltransferase